MKAALLFTFWVLTLNSYSQSNSVALYSGPEFYFPTTGYFQVDSLAQSLNWVTERHVIAGGLVECQFIHQWKSGFSIQTGFNLSWYQYTFNYPIDSTPLPHPANDYFQSQPIRNYDSKYQYSGMALTVELMRMFKLSHKFDWAPLVGAQLGFDFVNKSTLHYYFVDTSGIADPGPFYQEYDEAKYYTNGMPDRISFTLGCVLSYSCTKTISFSAFPEAHWAIDFHDYSLKSNFSMPVKAGIIYSIN